MVFYRLSSASRWACDPGYGPAAEQTVAGPWGLRGRRAQPTRTPKPRPAGPPAAWPCGESHAATASGAPLGPAGSSGQGREVPPHPARVPASASWTQALRPQLGRPRILCPHDAVLPPAGPADTWIGAASEGRARGHTLLRGSRARAVRAVKAVGRGTQGFQLQEGPGQGPRRGKVSGEAGGEAVLQARPLRLPRADVSLGPCRQRCWDTPRPPVPGGRDPVLCKTCPGVCEAGGRLAASFGVGVDRGPDEHLHGPAPPGTQLLPTWCGARGGAAVILYGAPIKQVAGGKPPGTQQPSPPPWLRSGALWGSPPPSPCLMSLCRKEQDRGPWGSPPRACADEGPQEGPDLRPRPGGGGGPTGRAHANPWNRHGSVGKRERECEDLSTRESLAQRQSHPVAVSRPRVGVPGPAPPPQTLAPAPQLRFNTAGIRGAGAEAQAPKSQLGLTTRPRGPRGCWLHPLVQGSSRQGFACHHVGLSACERVRPACDGDAPALPATPLRHWSSSVGVATSADRKPLLRQLLTCLLDPVPPPPPSPPPPPPPVHPCAQAVNPSRPRSPRDWPEQPGWGPAWGGTVPGREAFAASVTPPRTEKQDDAPEPTEPWRPGGLRSLALNGQREPTPGLSLDWNLSTNPPGPRRAPQAPNPALTGWALPPGPTLLPPQPSPSREQDQEQMGKGSGGARGAAPPQPPGTPAAQRLGLGAARAASGAAGCCGAPRSGIQSLQGAAPPPWAKVEAAAWRGGIFGTRPPVRGACRSRDRKLRTALGRGALGRQAANPSCSSGPGARALARPPRKHEAVACSSPGRRGAKASRWRPEKESVAWPARPRSPGSAQTPESLRLTAATCSDAAPRHTDLVGGSELRGAQPSPPPAGFAVCLPRGDKAQNVDTSGHSQFARPELGCVHRGRRSVTGRPAGRQPLGKERALTWRIRSRPQRASRGVQPPACALPGAQPGLGTKSRRGRGVVGRADSGRGPTGGGRPRGSPLAGSRAGA
uniref:basic proline-rich protein-like n=1 Tax=Nyctereutes procyonoides TaxID=34880 RepID=UPI0024449361|nr:basic proline-rich protein-like [Nyctereutes procyonoides]